MAPVIDRPEEKQGANEPLVASFLSLLFPGLGQLYSGQFHRGLLFQVTAIVSYFLIGTLALVSSILSFIAGLARSNNVKLNDGLCLALSNVPAPFMFILSLLLLGFVCFAARDAYGLALRKLYPRQGALYPDSFIGMPEALSCSYIFHITSVVLCFILAFFFLVPPPPHQQVTEFEFVENQESEKPKEKTKLRAVKASTAGGKFDPSRPRMAPRPAAASAQSKEAQSNPNQSRPEQSSISKSEAQKAEAAKTRTAKAEPVKAEPVKAENAKAVPNKSDAKPVDKAEPVQAPVAAFKPILKPLSASAALPKPTPATTLAAAPNLPNITASHLPSLTRDLSKELTKAAPNPLSTLAGPSPVKPITVAGVGPTLPFLRSSAAPSPGAPQPQIGPVGTSQGTASNTSSSSGADKDLHPVPISSGGKSSDNSGNHSPGPSRAGSHGTANNTGANSPAGSMVSPVVSSSDKFKGTDSGLNLGNGKGKPNPNAGALDVSYAEFMNDLQRRIKRNWFPPKGPDSSRIKVIFAVLRSGELVDSSIRLISSSGVASADQAAIAAIRNAAPYRTLPTGAPERIDVEFTFDYSVFGGHMR